MTATTTTWTQKKKEKNNSYNKHEQEAITSQQPDSVMYLFAKQLVCRLGACWCSILPFWMVYHAWFVEKKIVFWEHRNIAEAAVTPHKSSSRCNANENVVVYTRWPIHTCAWNAGTRVHAHYADMAHCIDTRDVQLNDEINIKEIHLTYCTGWAIIFTILIGRRSTDLIIILKRC